MREPSDSLTDEELDILGLGPNVNTAKVCGRMVGQSICGAAAIVHAAITPNVENTAACAEHLDFMLREMAPIQWHEIGAACGEEGSLWSFSTNECLMPDWLALRRAVAEAGGKPLTVEDVHMAMWELEQ